MYLTYLFSDLPPVDENASIDLSFLSTRSDSSAESEPRRDVSAGGSFMTADAGGTQDADFMTKLEYIIVEGQQCVNESPLNSPSAVSASSPLIRKRHIIMPKPVSKRRSTPSVPRILRNQSRTRLLVLVFFLLRCSALCIILNRPNAAESNFRRFLIEINSFVIGCMRSGASLMIRRLIQRSLRHGATTLNMRRANKGSAILLTKTFQYMLILLLMNTNL
jgi:hypothetical protein